MNKLQHVRSTILTTTLHRILLLKKQDKIRNWEGDRGKKRLIVGNEKRNIRERYIRIVYFTG